MSDSDFALLMDQTVVLRRPRPEDPLNQAIGVLVTRLGLAESAQGGTPRQRIEALCAEIDRRMAAAINLILHHPEFQALEATWRGLDFLVQGIEAGAALKVRILDISKRELIRSLRKFRGAAWDQSPLFRKIYEEEYGQFGGEPFGVLIGDYTFDHRPEDVQTMADIAKIAAAAHTPFIAAAAPAVMQMDSWAELANPRDLTRIFQTPEYAVWRSLREAEDSRYLGLCLPRFLGRLPYGARTDPVDQFAFEERAEGPDGAAMLWCNAAYAFGTNIARAFQLYGWCTRIRGVDSGGTVQDLPVARYSTADGETDLLSLTELALSERREAELAKAGFIPLVYRPHTGTACFISAQSLQRPFEYEDEAATANAVISARLPYIFAASRFAHYLKCMVRDKVGSTMSREALAEWLSNWLVGYVDGSPATSSEEWKAAHPLAEGRVVLEEHEAAPGQYEAKFYLRPHYQLEGLTVALRLVSRLPAH